MKFVYVIASLTSILLCLTSTSSLDVQFVKNPKVTNSGAHGRISIKTGEIKTINNVPQRENVFTLDDLIVWNNTQNTNYMPLILRLSESETNPSAIIDVAIGAQRTKYDNKFFGIPAKYFTLNTAESLQSFRKAVLMEKGSTGLLGTNTTVTSATKIAFPSTIDIATLSPLYSALVGYQFLAGVDGASGRVDWTLDASKNIKIRGLVVQEVNGLNPPYTLSVRTSIAGNKTNRWGLPPKSTVTTSNSSIFADGIYEMSKIARSLYFFYSFAVITDKDDKILAIGPLTELQFPVQYRMKNNVAAGPIGTDNTNFAFVPRTRAGSDALRKKGADMTDAEYNAFMNYDHFRQHCSGRVFKPMPSFGLFISDKLAINIPTLSQYGVNIDDRDWEELHLVLLNTNTGAMSPPQKITPVRVPVVGQNVSTTPEPINPLGVPVGQDVTLTAAPSGPADVSMYNIAAIKGLHNRVHCYTKIVHIK